MIGIFTCDPGGSSGLAWAVVDETKDTAVEAVAARLHGGSATVTGEPLEQAREIWTQWSIFKDNCVAVWLLKPEQVELVLEDFILYGGSHAGGRDGTAPERMAYAFLGYRQGRFDTYRKERHLTPVTWQMSGAAARYKKRTLLLKANAWTPGKAGDHVNSAHAHMLLRVNKIMDTNVR